MARFLDTQSPRVLSLVRMVTGLLFLEHGLQKLIGFPIPTAKPIALFSLMGLAGSLELAGGILLILGLLTRPLAFLLCGEMAFAYFLSHAPKSFFPVINGGDPAILFCFIFLYLFFAGPGVWSLDSRFSNPKRA